MSKWKKLVEKESVVELLHSESLRGCYRQEPPNAEASTKGDHEVLVASLADFPLWDSVALQSDAVHHLHSIQDDGYLVTEDYKDE